MQVKPGSIVRVASILSADTTQYIFATVLTVAPSFPELVGEDGEPTLAVAYLKADADPAALGSSNWHNGFIRQADVAHATHADVLSGKRGIYWIDVLPDASTGLEHADLPGLTTGSSSVFDREKVNEFYSQPGVVTVPRKLAPVPNEPSTTTPPQTPSIPAAGTGQAVPVTSTEPTSVLAETQPVPGPASEPATGSPVMQIDPLT